MACNVRTSLNELFVLLRDLLAQRFGFVAAAKPEYRDFRPGDVRHSQADISRARELLGYAPTHDVQAGLRAAMPWYVANFGAATVELGSADSVRG